MVDFGKPLRNGRERTALEKISNICSCPRKRRRQRTEGHTTRRAFGSSRCAGSIEIRGRRSREDFSLMVAATFGDIVDITKGAKAMSRDQEATIKLIQDNLQERSGKTWDVHDDREGWIKIDAPCSQRIGQDELANLLGLRYVAQLGVNVPPGDSFYQEMVDRSRDHIGTRTGYWN